MHIFFIVSWYKTPSHPFVGTFFEEQARALMKKGFRVGVFYPEIDMRFRSRFKAGNGQSSSYIDEGLPTISCTTRSIIPFSRKINYWYLGYCAKQRFDQYVLKHGKPDIIHAHCVFKAGITARYISKKTGIPYLVTEHYTGLSIGDVDRISYNRRIIKKVYEEAAKVLMVSNFLIDDLRRKYLFKTDNVTVLHNLVSDIFFSGPIVSADSRKIILFTNSFITSKKNHKLLLDSLLFVVKEVPDVILKIGGDGPLRKECEKYAISIGIDANILFLGELNRDQVKENLDGCTIFLSTSRYETFGVSIAEALACGKPVVATDSGGPRDIIGVEDGLLIRSHDPISFSNGVLQVIQNYYQYNPNGIRKRCYERFSEEKVANSLADIYKHIVPE